MDEEPTQSNIMENTEEEEPVDVFEDPAESVLRANKRDEKMEKIMKKVKEVLAQRPNKAKSATVIVVCYKGKKRRSKNQLAKKEETPDHSSSPNNAQ